MCRTIYRTVCLLKAGLVAVCLLGSFAGALELNESPAKPGEWGFRPADGTQADLNPPAFSWRPVGKASGYTLEIASDPGFDRVVYRLERTQWSAHCPPESLKPGEYYWRYAALGEADERSAWSMTRRFTVPQSAPIFPQPSLEDLVSRLPSGHPRIFFRPADVDRLKGLAAGPLADSWAVLIAKADKLLESPPDTTEPPKYPPGIEHKGGEWREIWWGNRLRAIAVSDGAATLAFVYRLTGEARYGEGARDLLLALCEWDTEGSTKHTYNDEAAMPLMYYPSRAYTWAYDALSESDRATIQKMMQSRGKQAFDVLELRRHLWVPYESHRNRVWHFLGEIAVAFLGEIPEAEMWLDYAMTIFYSAYPVWGVQDGGWHEGPSYWASYLERFMYWAELARAGFGIDVFQKPFFSNTGYYPMYIMPPGSTGGQFADMGQTASSSRLSRFMAVFAATARQPHWKWYADEHHADLGGGYMGFLYAARAGDLEGEAPVALPPSIAFRDAGIAVMNTNLLDGKDNVQVQFKSSPFGQQSHGYNANNTFLLNLRGAPVLIPSGRRDVHGSRHHREWMWETKSDNAILVDGKGQRPHAPDSTGEITVFDSTPSIDVVAGEAGASYDHVNRWTRRLIFFKPHAMLIHDVLEAPEPATYQWLLHAPGSPFEIGENRVGWKGENGSIDVRFLQPLALKISQTDQFDTPPADWSNLKLEEWHLRAETTEKQAKIDFITLIAIDGVEAEASLEDTGGMTRVQLRLADTEAEVLLGSERFEITAPDHTCPK